jgi:hypothetical protein
VNIRLFPAITKSTSAVHHRSADYRDSRGNIWESGRTPIPSQSLIVPQGQLTLFSSGTMIAQPLTQLITKTHPTGRRRSSTSRDDLKKAENRCGLDVHTLYCILTPDQSWQPNSRALCRGN